MSEAGKGDSPRPILVSRSIFERNWNNIFRKKNTKDGENEEATVRNGDCGNDGSYVCKCKCTELENGAI